MPSRPMPLIPVAADGSIDSAGLTDAVEHLRRGTREQYESTWMAIAASATGSFTHGLEEIPWFVGVIRSEESDGSRPTDATAEVTVTKTTTTISVVNGAASSYYFRVRAM